MKTLLAVFTLITLIALGLTGCGGGGSSTPGTPEGTEYGIAVLNTDFSDPSIQPVIYDGIWSAPIGRLSFTLRVTGSRGVPACDFELLKSDDPMWAPETAVYKRIVVIKAGEVPEYTFKASANYKIRALTPGTTCEIAHTFLQIDENWTKPQPPTNPVTLSVTSEQDYLGTGTTRVTMEVTNDTDAEVGGVILWIGTTPKSSPNAEVQVWYGFNDDMLNLDIDIMDGQVYKPGSTYVFRNAAWVPYGNDDINSEDGIIIGDMEPRESRMYMVWFVDPRG